MNNNYAKENKFNKKNKLSIKDFTEFYKYQKYIEFNGYNIIELNEEENNQVNEKDLSIIFTDKEIINIKKKAKSIEEYYINKFEESTINENCFNCLLNNFNPNELLYFSKKKDLIIYLKYCFYFLKNIVFTDNETYNQNKFELDKCDINYLNGWKFFIPKTICRGCFMKIINMKNLFLNLKNIFIDFNIESISKSHYGKRKKINKINYFINKKSNNKSKNKSKEEIKNNIKIKKVKKNKLLNNVINNSKKGDEENSLLSIKKIIFEDNNNNYDIKLIGENNKKTNGYINIKNSELNSNKNEQCVSEIIIKSNESSEGKKLKKQNKDNKNKINNNELLIKKDENKKELNNTNIINEQINGNVNLCSKQNINEKDIINNDSKNPLLITNIYISILITKNISEKVGILHHQLINLQSLLFYIIINIGDFREKFYNSMIYNPNLISSEIPKFEQYFLALYNQVSLNLKQYEELYKDIKKDSIDSILKNILNLKEQNNIKDVDKVNLEEMEKNVNDLVIKNEEIKEKIEDLIYKCFGNLIFLFKEIQEIKAAFKGNTFYKNN